MNKARIAENTIAPEPTDRPYVPQNRPLGPLFRQTCVILPVAIKKALEVEIVPVYRPLFWPVETHQQKRTNNMDQNRPKGSNPDAADFG